MAEIDVLDNPLAAAGAVAAAGAGAAGAAARKLTGRRGDTSADPAGKSGKYVETPELASTQGADEPAVEGEPRVLRSCARIGLADTAGCYSRPPPPARQAH